MPDAPLVPLPTAAEFAEAIARVHHAMPTSEEAARNLAASFKPPASPQPPSSDA